MTLFVFSLPFALSLLWVSSNARAQADPSVHIQAEEVTGRPDRELHLHDQVEIIRGATRIDAESATHNIIDNSVNAQSTLPNCVRMQHRGDAYTGESLQLNLDSWQGFVVRPTYQLGINGAHGVADRGEFEDEDRARLYRSTYTTCPGTQPDWYLRMNTLDIDLGRNEGVARGSLLYFKGVPILGAPWLSFPLSSERRSGVLPPIFGMSNRGGAEITLPYYFNIAPQRDLTLYPHWISERGLQMGAEARYLNPLYQGETQFEVLPNDNLTRTNRYALQSRHVQRVAAVPGLSMGWQVNYASDDAYPDDFSRSLTESSQRLLNRQFNLNYASRYWQVSAVASRYQLLQDFDVNGRPLLSRPYDRLPQVSFTAARQDIGGFDWTVQSEYARFWHNEYRVSPSRPYSPTLPLGGERVFINPQLSYPVLRPGYFITPKIQWDATAYRLSGVPQTTLPDGRQAEHSLSRALPIASVDSGLIFERDVRIANHALTQTLEPRLFYVRTPHRDQNDFPLFDTAGTDFNFSQIFTENRYVGHDRISDANQLTAAVTSRFIEDSGAERFRFAIGQRFYFSQPKVALNDHILTSHSDVLVGAGGQILPTLSVDSNFQYSQTNSALMRANTTLSWRPAPKKVLNLAYRLDRTTNALALNNNEVLKQIDLSGQWPLAKRWYGVGRFNYSLEEKKLADTLLGLEYKADCWIFRIVAQRLPTSTRAATSFVFLQLELNGLSALGSNPLPALRSSIPGYQNINHVGGLGY